MPTIQTRRGQRRKAGGWIGQREMEMALFVGASLVGIYGLGQGLNGLFEPGKGINLLWLAITGIALFVLFAQMGRVHDSWPRRPRPEPRAEAQPMTTTDSETAASATADT